MKLFGIILSGLFFLANTALVLGASETQTAKVKHHLHKNIKKERKDQNSDLNAADKDLKSGNVQGSEKEEQKAVTAQNKIHKDKQKLHALNKSSKGKTATDDWEGGNAASPMQSSQVSSQEVKERDQKVPQNANNGASNQTDASKGMGQSSDQMSSQLKASDKAQ